LLPHGIDRLIGALERQPGPADTESEITISWEAARAAADLCGIWGIDRLDDFRQHLMDGQPTR
jgi:hypothetical protein